MDGKLKLKNVLKGHSGKHCLESVWPDWATYWTYGNFSKPLKTNKFAQISHILREFL